MDNEDLEVVATYLATKREIAKHKAVIRRYQESMGSLVEVLKKHDPEDLSGNQAGDRQAQGRYTSVPGIHGFACRSPEEARPGGLRGV